MKALDGSTAGPIAWRSFDQETFSSKMVSSRSWHHALQIAHSTSSNQQCILEQEAKVSLLAKNGSFSTLKNADEGTWGIDDEELISSATKLCLLGIPALVAVDCPGTAV